MKAQEFIKEKWSGPKSAKKSQKIMAGDRWEDVFDSHWRLSELKPKEINWWKKAYSLDKKSVMEVLQTLDSLASRHTGTPNNAVPYKKLSNKAQAFITQYSGSKTYKYLYRGVELNSEANIEGLSPGDIIPYNSKFPSFWSQDPEWAGEFVQWWGYLLKIKMNPTDIILDMNLIPYGISPDGYREPEVIIRAGRYKPTIAQLSSSSGLY